jgi:MFS superfamily sulfate permease-like transporter
LSAPVSEAADRKRLRHTRALIRNTVAGVVVGLSALSFYISSASLIFQGALAQHAPVGIAASLLGGALLSLFAAGRSGLPLVSAGAVAATVPVLAAMVAGVAAAAAPAAALPTALAALALTAAATGAVWWVMGARGWGDMASYIPYPVVGGFMAATGGCWQPAASASSRAACRAGATGQPGCMRRPIRGSRPGWASDSCCMP